MASGIIFLEKNKIDLDLGTAATITITDATATDNGQSFVDFMRNRKNSSGWATTGSNDAANTQIEIVFPTADINRIMLVEHNLKAYTIKYWNGAAYVDFSTVIAETINTATTKMHTFNSVNTSQIRITITGTMVANDDKFIAQIIISQLIGQFNSFFDIKRPLISRNRKELKSVSGKSRIIRNVGAFSCKLSLDNVIDTNDLTIIEDLFEYNEGFLVWLCGGDQTQFRTVRMGYRLQDIFLMNCKNDYSPEWDDGWYGRGVNIDIDLVESL